MKRATRLKLLISLTVVVWTAAIGALSARGRLSAKAPGILTLRTQPHIVHITVNGKALDEGAWIETPRRLPLTPGRNRLRIMRDGFQTSRLDVELESGESLKMDDIVLIPKANTSLGQVQVGAAGDEANSYFEIDGGIARGDMPMRVDDLAAGKHVLAVYPAWPDPEPRLRCRFTIDPEATNDILVLRARKRPAKEPGKEASIKLSGCDKPSAAKDQDAAKKKKGPKSEQAPTSETPAEATE